MKKYFTVLVFAAFSLLIHNVAHAAAPANCVANPKAASGTVKREGKHFTVVVEGTGPDVVLIPGLATPRQVWEPTVSGLRNCYTFHIVQIRGFGDEGGINADGPVLDPFVKELADYIDDEITDKGRASPAIIGHSLGGLSALMIAAHYPQETGKVMVVDALPYIGTLFNPAATVETVKPQAEAMAAAMRSAYGKPQPAPSDADPGAQSIAGQYSNTVAGRTAVARWMHASDARVIAQAFYDDMTTDMRGDLAKIMAPVTLLYAQDDSAFSAEAAKAMFEPQYASLPYFTAHMITGSRHFIMLDQPEKFAAEVAAFLAN